MLRGDGDRLVSTRPKPGRADAGVHRLRRYAHLRGPAHAATGGDARVTVAGLSTSESSSMPRSRPDHLRFSPDGSRLAVGGSFPVVLDARTHRVLARLRIGADRFIYALRFSPDGRTLFAAIALRAVRHVDPALRCAHRPAARRGAARQPRPRHVDAQSRRPAHDDDQLRRGHPRHRRPHAASARRLPIGAQQAALSPDDRTMLARRRRRLGALRQPGHGEVRRASGRHDGAVVESAFSADGRTAVTAGADGRLIVWDVRRASPRETLEGHGGQITGLAISRDSSTLYTTGLDGKVADLGSRRRPPPRPPVQGRAEQPRVATLRA